MVGSSPMLITRLAGCECIVSIDGDRGTIDRDCCKTDNDLKGVIGLSGGVLHLNLEKMTAHLLPPNSKTAKDWRARQARKAKRDEARLTAESQLKRDAKE